SGRGRRRRAPVSGPETPADPLFPGDGAGGSHATSPVGARIYSVVAAFAQGPCEVEGGRVTGCAACAPASKTAVNRRPANGRGRRGRACGGGRAERRQDGSSGLPK